MRFQVVVQDAGVHEAMRATRRGLNQDVKAVMAEAGEGILLPAGKRAVPVRTGELRRSLIFRATTTGGYVTSDLTRRRGGRRFGLLEFGGTRRDVIEPRRRRSLLINGRPVARVTRPRVYPARLWVTKARDRVQPQVVALLETRVAETIQVHIDRHSTYTT